MPLEPRRLKKKKGEKRGQLIGTAKYISQDVPSFTAAAAAKADGNEVTMTRWPRRD